MVTITLRPLRRYSPISILCEKRPELSFPTSVTPFSLAAFLALASSIEGLAEISMLNVLAMPVSAHHPPSSYLPFPTNDENRLTSEREVTGCATGLLSLYLLLLCC
jgi:hypothetical protein